MSEQQLGGTLPVMAVQLVGEDDGATSSGRACTASATSSFGGRPGRMAYEPGQKCAVHVQQREYTDGRGYQRIEATRLTGYGPEREATLCAHAKELAAIAGSRIATA